MVLNSRWSINDRILRVYELGHWWMVLKWKNLLTGTTVISNCKCRGNSYLAHLIHLYNRNNRHSLFRKENVHCHPGRWTGRVCWGHTVQLLKEQNQGKGIKTWHALQYRSKVWQNWILTHCNRDENTTCSIVNIKAAAWQNCFVKPQSLHFKTIHVYLH